jgi:glycosyltransferase involved in cell wall biosynthesis
VTETLEAVKEELSKNHYDLIHAETFYMMPNIPKTDVPIILVEQTIEYLGYQSYAKASKFWPIKPLLYMDIAKIKYWEQYYWQHCDRLITMSDNDRDYIRSRHQHLNQIDVVANGVDSEFFDAVTKKLPESPTVLIVGTFKWLPNIEAVTYLVEKIWPLVLANMPTAKLHIVGYSPTEKILSYGKDASITVSGNLDDIRSAYATAHVLLAPVKSGKGTRYKILEAMATRTPIVATPLAVEGIAGVVDGKHALLAKGPMELAKHTVRVLQDASLQKKLADNSKRLVSSNYDWKAISADLNRVYQELGSSQKATRD